MSNRELLSNDDIIKLKKLANCFDVQIVKDSVILSFKNNLCIHSTGNQIIYSEKEIAIKGQKLHLNPETNINNNDISTSFIKINKDNARLLNQINLND